MNSIFLPKTLFFIVIFLCSGGCAYYNTFYNAQQYYKEAEKIRLQKEGKSIPITALDKYGKTIQKCQKVLSDYPESKFRTDAFLLMAKSKYYRKDYDLAIDDLRIVTQDGDDNQIEEAQYLRALCKWKKGNAQTGINELTILLNISPSKEIQSKCHLSLAKIAQELKDSDLAMSHLLDGAKLTKSRDQKGVIYGRLAEMAFNKEDYDIAKDSYANVITNSLSKEQIENAHLQLLKILRIQKNYKAASRKIKGMLTDDKFKRISGNLELELVQLYRAQGEISEIETRLESIVNDYQRTLVSAEAYYLLGKIYTSQKWDLKKAKEYFDQVSKESSKSLFSPMAKSLSKAIGAYQEAEKDLETHLTILTQDTTQISTESDTSVFDPETGEAIIETLNPLVSAVAPDRTIPELYYQLADLEAFSFKRYTKGIQYLNQINSEYPESPFHAKSIFTMAFMFENMADSVNAQSTRDHLLESFPNSEYAAYISEDVKVEKKKQEILYSKAESQVTSNPDNAIQLLKESIILNEKSDLAVSAAYTISYHYDQSTEIDSALKYYQWIQDNHPRSDQYHSAAKRVQTLQMVLSSIETVTDTINIIRDDN
ncbi:MAG: tetratricopeptide repeat protein [Candidatus Marinimicrobia bacterium]|jgi:tetratricopeptide (TPR) repeat protein|nr:tetratricopeptide repeat protein [Candidatus Neomarinimicrobiota bacterium]